MKAQILSLTKRLQTTQHEMQDLHVYKTRTSTAEHAADDSVLDYKELELRAFAHFYVPSMHLYVRRMGAGSLAQQNQTSRTKPVTTRPRTGQEHRQWEDGIAQ